MVIRTCAISSAVLLACASSGTATKGSVAPLAWCNPCPMPCSVGCEAPVAKVAVAPVPKYVPPPSPSISPAFDPVPGEFTAPQSVTLSTPTPNAAIYYTTDGSTPTAASTLYTGPIRVEKTTTVRAIAVAPNQPESSVSEGAYAVAPPARVTVTANKLELKEKIYFDTGKATIKPESHGILDEAAQVLVAHPEVKKVRVEGHTDSSGSASANTALSQARAKAVREYLVGKGVAADRLSAKGYGPTRPIADNKTAEGREANRRVDFTIE